MQGFASQQSADTLEKVGAAYHMVESAQMTDFGVDTRNL